uniref:Uncharacterized protein n=1 Tax=viral metagenome TaxID=1070528 RepID=A0A6C0IHY9_9ZZZZ
MAHQNEKIEISNVTREFIVDKLVEPYYRDMVKTTINGKKWWRTMGITLETCSKLMVALGGIFSFSAGFYHDDTLSFVSGSISCLSLALLQIASFSYKENKKQGDELNILLKKLNLDTVPTMPRSEDQAVSSQRQQVYSAYQPLQSPQRGLNRMDTVTYVDNITPPRRNSLNYPLHANNNNNTDLDSTML